MGWSELYDADIGVELVTETLHKFTINNWFQSLVCQRFLFFFSTPLR